MEEELIKKFRDFEAMLQELKYMSLNNFERIELECRDIEYYKTHNTEVFSNMAGLYKVPLLFHPKNEYLRGNYGRNLKNYINYDNKKLIYKFEKNKCRGITLNFPINAHNIKYLVGKIFAEDLEDAHISIKSPDNKINLEFTIEEFKKSFNIEIIKSLYSHVYLNNRLLDYKEKN